jgi:hypothetical protein
MEDEIQQLQHTEALQGFELDPIVSLTTLLLVMCGPVTGAANARYLMSSSDPGENLLLRRAFSLLHQLPFRAEERAQGKAVGLVTPSQGLRPMDTPRDEIGSVCQALSKRLTFANPANPPQNDYHLYQYIKCEDRRLHGRIRADPEVFHPDNLEALFEDEADRVIRVLDHVEPVPLPEDVLRTLGIGDARQLPIGVKLCVCRSAFTIAYLRLFISGI